MPKKFIRFYFVIFGILDLLATGTAFILSFSVLLTFFSYFTVLSNILITSLFLYFGFAVPKKISKTLEWVYGAAVLYMTITGVIYWSILVNAHSLSLDPWINLTMHGVMPIAALFSWVIAPLKNRILSKNAAFWLIPPLLFVFYTLIHGRFINWYPYPFLSPIASGSLLQVVKNVVLILFGTWIVGLILIWIRNYLNRK